MRRCSMHEAARRFCAAVSVAMLVCCCLVSHSAHGDGIECWQRGLISTTELPFVEVEKIVVENDRAYFHYFPQFPQDFIWGIDVYDVSNPSLPAFLGSQVWPGHAVDFKVVGNMAYVVDTLEVPDDEGFWIVDVSDPTNLEILNYVSRPRSRRIFVQDGIAYLATDVEGGQFEMIDVSDPLQPVLLGVFDPPSSPSHHYEVFEVVGNVVFADTSSIETFNVSDPQEIRQIGDLRNVGSADLFGDYLYGSISSADRNGLSVHDATSPRVLEELAFLPLHSGQGCFCATQGFVCRGTSVVDVSDPLNPIPRGHVVFQSVDATAALSGTTLYLADGNVMSAYNIVDAAGSSLLGTKFINNINDRSNRAMRIQGDFAFVAAGKKGLRVYDISDLLDPDRVSRYDTPGCSLDVDVLGGIACIADELAFEVFDVSDPSNPLPLATVDFSADIVKVRMSGNVAYVGLGVGLGLRAIDLTDPINPQVVGQYIINTGILDMEIQGDRIYVSTFGGGLHVVDATDPTALVRLGRLPDVILETIEVSGNYVYGAYPLDNHGLRIFDVSDPTTPTLLGSFDPLILDRPTRILAIDGTDLYAAGDGSVFKIDISNPAAPNVLGYANHGDVDIAVIVGNALLGLEEPVSFFWRIIDIGECTLCRPDIADSDGAGSDQVVDVFDLLEILSNWGTNGPGADIEPATNVVDVFDLLALLAAWGPCQ